MFVVEESHTKLGTINLLGPASSNSAGVCGRRVAACAPPDTIAIVGLDGYARAKAHFTPLAPPWVGGGPPLLPPQAYVADGRVFFIDGLGVVRSLGLDGSVRTVASFPLGPKQQEASFAVSPDGRHLVATVITLPSAPAVVNGGVWGFGPGSWVQNIYIADAGGPSRLASHTVLSQGSQAASLLQFVSWGPSGPVATYPANFQAGGWSDAEKWEGPLVQVNASTMGISGALGSYACVTDVLADGSYVCADGGVSVFGVEGNRLWQFTKPSWGIAQGDGPSTGVYLASLSPDGQSVAASGPITPASELIKSNGTEVHLPQSLLALGWINDQRVIGWIGAGEEMAMINISSPMDVVDLGFQGIFVGSFP